MTSRDEQTDEQCEAALKARWEQRGRACECGEPIPLEDALDQMGECGACFHLGSELGWSLQR